MYFRVIRKDLTNSYTIEASNINLAWNKVAKLEGLKAPNYCVEPSGVQDDNADYLVYNYDKTETLFLIVEIGCLVEPFRG